MGHGKFSSPPVICDEAHLGEVSKILQDVDITCRDFSESLKRMAPGDFGYIDPPYWPVSETANFTSFTPEGFTRQDQEDLAESCRVLTDQGVFLMVSNSDTPFTRRLYKGFNICKVEARRCVNSAGKKRGSVPELLMTNY
ncbi:MAG: adenine methylase protein [Candidatus Gottesmanbacteria bacterium GW2011_GWB1_49_7]|uniref:Adenine methylase protein n=1 Tax=Candidatus Gottesmanbacteria bacterium GW2011_GWB1_49_7 TaxID=1618448 RepID=A0A0G1W2T6_9BACT|nr:MAG: adenine methylase protein [Candidatus Gottesmanbacteria bacterium GW2011_GWB1_49_7]